MIIAEPKENYSSGYIKLYRSLKNKGWYKKSEYVHLWLHLLLKANHCQKEWLYKNKSFAVKSGQFITSRKALSEETGINQSQIERILKCFEIEQQIEQQNLFTSRLITITYWDEYQKPEQQIEQQNNSKITANEQQNNTNNNINNVKNDNNVKNIKTYSEQSPEVELSKLLFSLMLKNNPIAKEPNFQKWAKNIDLMIRIDKRSIDDIKGAIIFSQQDSFWHTNILSTSKLREQFDKLLLKARSNGNGRNNQISGTRDMQSSTIEQISELFANN